MESPPTKPTPRLRFIHSIVKRAMQQRVFVFLGLCVGSALYLLLYLGDKLGSLGQTGSNIAQVWSFIAAIFELVISIAAIGVAIWLHNKTPGTASPKVAQQARRTVPGDHWWPRLAVGLAFALLAFWVPPAISAFSFWQWGTEDVTHRIELANNANMKDGSSARAKLPTTKHHHLKIKFGLESQVSTGSCVAPARLKIVPTFNGSNGQELTQIPTDTWQNIELGDMSEPGELVIDLNLGDDPYCAIKLNVDSAFYYH